MLCFGPAAAQWFAAVATTAHDENLVPVRLLEQASLMVRQQVGTALEPAAVALVVIEQEQLLVALLAELLAELRVLPVGHHC